MKLTGYKVVNYSSWQSIPDIFSSVSEAEKGAEGWKFRKGAVIERISSFQKETKVIKTLR